MEVAAFQRCPLISALQLNMFTAACNCMCVADLPVGSIREHFNMLVDRVEYLYNGQVVTLNICLLTNISPNEAII